MIFSENRYPLFGIMLELAPVAGIEPAYSPLNRRRRAPCLALTGKIGGVTGSRTPAGLLARRACAPAPTPSVITDYWNGAQGRFRAHLSAASARRFHQISFLGASGN